MSTDLNHSDSKHEYAAIEAVSQRDRNLTSWDMFAIWVGANANNGSWYVGGVIAATSFFSSICVLAIANPIAYVVMALIGFIGFRVGISTMALTRPTFGVKGSFLPSLLNTTQFIGWTAVNTFIAAISISFICKEWLGWPAIGDPGGNLTMMIGIITMSILHLISIVAGHHSVRIVERIGVGLVILLAIWETVVVLHNVSLSQIMAWRPPVEKAMPFGTAIDIMAAFSLGWVPAIAEFTRYSKNKTAATWIPMLGANIGLFWFALTGIVVTIGTTITTGTYDPNNSDPSTIVSKLGLGVIAFLVIIITSMTANAINLMAAGISLTNINPKIKAIPALWGVTTVAAIVTTLPLYIGSFLHTFILFLEYIGMVFGPIFSIVIVDYYFIAKQRYYTAEIDLIGGRYWFGCGYNWPAIAIWIVGVISFLAIRELPLFANSIGATYPVMSLTAVIYYAVSSWSVTIREK